MLDGTSRSGKSHHRGNSAATWAEISRNQPSATLKARPIRVGLRVRAQPQVGALGGWADASGQTRSTANRPCMRPSHSPDHPLCAGEACLASYGSPPVASRSAQSSEDLKEQVGMSSKIIVRAQRHHLKASHQLHGGDRFSFRRSGLSPPEEHSFNSLTWFGGGALTCFGAWSAEAVRLLRLTLRLNL